MTTSPLDPRIGVLVRDGKQVHYAFVRGCYTEGKPETLLAKLNGTWTPRPRKQPEPQS